LDGRNEDFVPGMPFLRGSSLTVVVGRDLGEVLDPDSRAVRYRETEPLFWPPEWRDYALQTA
jgi:hypothetical protein